MSGGMNQRVMIAMAIACNPRLLIADEPTTALDVTIQAQILDLLRNLQKERGMALVLITHNMGVVSEMAQRVAVMYAGQVMEQQPRGRSCSPIRSIPTPRRCWRRCPSAAPAGHRLATIPGVVPGVFDRPDGCLFAPRCAYATAHSVAVRPELRAWQDGQVRCHYPLGDPQREARHRSATRRCPIEVARMSRCVVEAQGPARRSTRSAAACCARPRSCRPWAACPSPSKPARRWRWSANRAAASPRSRAWCR